MVFGGLPFRNMERNMDIHLTTGALPHLSLHTRNINARKSLYRNCATKTNNLPKMAYVFALGFIFLGSLRSIYTQIRMCACEYTYPFMPAFLRMVLVRERAVRTVNATSTTMSKTGFISCHSVFVCLFLIFLLV